MAEKRRTEEKKGDGELLGFLIEVKVELTRRRRLTMARTTRVLYLKNNPEPRTKQGNRPCNEEEEKNPDDRKDDVLAGHG